MPDIVMEPGLLLGVVFWWALTQWLQWNRHRPHGCLARQRTLKTKARLVLPGLIQKPHCECCAQDAQQATSARSLPPPRIVHARGRPRRIDTSGHYCPNERCGYYGWLGLGNVRANGHPNGRSWRQLECVACGHFFLENHGTLCYGKTHAVETILRAIAALAEGLGIRGVSRVFGVEANTILSWLEEAAEHAEAVSNVLLRELQIEQVQLDELFALVGEFRSGRISEAQVIERLARRPRWVWTAIDPLSKLRLQVSVGERSLAMAQQFVHQLVQRLAGGCHPLFLSDGLKHYGTALLTHFGQWVQFPRRQAQGPTPKPRWCALPHLRYAQVVKQCRRRRLVKLIQRVVFGGDNEIKGVLAAYGWTINTAFVERLNLTLRQHVAALGRRVSTLAKTEAGLLAQLHLFQLYYNLCLPHTSLPPASRREGREVSERGTPRGPGITPAMAAGLTDHVWSLREVLLWRIPPWPQAALD